MTAPFAVVEPEPRHARNVARTGGHDTVEPKHCACQPCLYGFPHPPLAAVRMPALEAVSA